MNELERAARAVAQDPGGAPTPVEEIRRRASTRRRRQRLVALAAAVPLVVVLVVASVAISRDRTQDGDRFLVLQTEDGPASATSLPPSTGPSVVGGPGTSAPDGTAMVTVYVATGPVARGTTGETVVADGLVGPTQIEARYAPSTAIRTTDALRQKVAVFDLAADTVIVEGMFVDPPPTGTPALPPPVRTPDGEQRMPWQLGTDQAVPFADATTLLVSATYGSCGYQFEFAAPVVSETADAIVVNLFAHEPSGSTLPRCSIDETTDLEVTLDAPVGDRRIYDGSQPVAVEVQRPSA